MIREEAIKMLKYNSNVIHQTIDGRTDPKEVEALDMAIEALEQEPCDDAISRQVVKEQMIKYGFHAPDMTVTEFVEDLPPVTPQPKTETDESSTESSTDCISREAAISAAKYIFESNSEMKAFCMMKMLEELPSVKPKDDVSGII